MVRASVGSVRRAVKNAEENSYQTVSYSYTDVITKDVQLTLC